MRIFTLITYWAKVFIVKLFTCLRVGIGSYDLPPDGVGKVAVEAIFAVAHVVVNAGVKASIDVFLATFLRVFALIDSEILLPTVTFDHLELVFEPLVLHELLVVH